MKPSQLLYTRDQITERVSELGKELTASLQEGAVIVGVLKGCLPFMADLVRELDLPIEVDFLALSSFMPDTGRVRLTRDLDTDITGKQVVLVEDLVDTGLRLNFLLQHLRGRSPSEVRVCAMFDRVERRVIPVELQHVGFELDSSYVVGYGLDHGGKFRNLPELVSVELGELERNSQEVCDQVYALGREHRLLSENI
ncbi:MAG: hypoxanthine phosphoribosyltransferase [Actinomycetota bacterium]|jgi:hypoxanthine phosphoribosyltransferase|nr:hypoxanthine phosphoribosyltransferase [Actinomycetota bacterium]MEE2646202.1 hypoxanthine phosphoribosyltransferase [Actinomycetota bacterium]|tara:strand:- start:447 stop:1037 length:591 start_codon:yes stop_codon:yes gene_type:complete